MATSEQLGRPLPKAGYCLKAKILAMFVLIWYCTYDYTKSQSLLRFKDKKMIFVHEFPVLPTHTGKQSQIHRRQDRNILTSNFREF